MGHPEILLPKGASENTDDIYYIHFKMRLLNSDFTKAKNDPSLFVDVIIKVGNWYFSKVVVQGNVGDLC